MRSPTRQPARPSRPAFTLIELLVVIAIIALLIALVTVVGSRVVVSSRENATRDAMRSMETVYDAFMADRGVLPSAGVQDPRTSGDPSDGRPVYLPIADARNLSGGDNTVINSMGLFLLQMEREGQPVQATITGLNPRLVALYSPDDGAAAAPQSPLASSAQQLEDEPLPLLRTVFDPWGNPLRYVHPAFSGDLYDATRQADGSINFPSAPNPNRPWDVRIALSEIDRDHLSISDIRRLSNDPFLAQDPMLPPEADGGICPAYGGRAYFYSAGADGDPTTRDDNVYLDSSMPLFPK
ncbi:MAG: prepilin-type N-terminal cleavage/methylation domain-containing protein [Phycisphaerales bacterium]